MSGTSQSTTHVQLANGSVVESAETATLKLHVQGHRTKCTFIVIDMIPGFDVVMGDDWSAAHQVTACYGTASADGTPSAPFLRLEHSQCLLRPGTHVGADAPAAKSPVLSAALTAN